jgi:uncharacterized protein (TIGR03437 family)
MISSNLKSPVSLSAMKWFSLFLAASALSAQVTLHPAPSRAIGHPQLRLLNLQPNWVEGKELNLPQGVALDTKASPPILYVSDTGNNRILAWRDALGFANGAPADLVIGQPDKFSTTPKGPGSSFSIGLFGPTGLAVFESDLYIVDSGNNRILRYPRPFAQQELIPDLVIGQSSFNSREANAGGLSERSISLSGGRGYLAFDATGNLYFTDAGNRRVLRYPAGTLVPGSRRAADLVLGQPDFTTPPATAAITLLTRDRLLIPTGIAVDSAGRVYVGDIDPARPVQFSRVLVFAPGSRLTNGAAAIRLMSVIPATSAPPTEETIARTLMAGPGGIAAFSGGIAVADTLSHRVLVFDAFEQWPDENVSLSPVARAVIGQDTFSGRSANRGQPRAAADRLSSPTALAATAAGDLLVADTGNHRMLLFMQAAASASRVLGQLRVEGSAVNLIEGKEVRFTAAAGSTGLLAEGDVLIHIDGDTPHLYVADTFNNRVLGFRDARKIKAGDIADLVIGQPDLFTAQCNFPANDVNTPTASSLCGPAALAVDSQGNLYVADAGNSRVLRFPQPFARAGGMQTADLVIGQAGFQAKITDATARTIANPSGLALTSGGLLVSDATHNRVLFFAGTSQSFSNGMTASQVLGQPPDFTSTVSGAGDNRLNSPRRLATDASERVYVADSGNNRVIIYNPVTASTPEPRAAIILNSAGSAALRDPRDVLVDPATGDIWVAEAGGNRLLRFAPAERLRSGAAPAAVVPAVGPFAIARDAVGSLYVAEVANRVTVYFPAVQALNGANFAVNRPLAPGVIASIFAQGAEFGRERKNFNESENPLPLPVHLADIEVLLDNQAVPLLFVSPQQINFVVPWNAPVFGTAELFVVSRSTGQVLGTVNIPMAEASPALFTLTSTGSGQVAALNSDDTVNGPSTPVGAGTVISMYGTGQGRLAGAPPDGAPAQGIISTEERPRVILNGVAVPDDHVLFSGLAPGFVGVWQINVRIPETQASGNAVPVVVQFKGVSSNNPQLPAQIRTTVAIRR